MKQLAIISQGEDDIESKLSDCVKGLENARVGAAARRKSERQHRQLVSRIRTVMIWRLSGNLKSYSPGLQLITSRRSWERRNEYETRERRRTAPVNCLSQLFSVSSLIVGCGKPICRNTEA